jgi:hypothetical protein
VVVLAMMVVVVVVLVLVHACDVVKPDAQQVTVIARNRNRNSGAQVFIPCNASATKGEGNRASSVERRVGEDRLSVGCAWCLVLGAWWMLVPSPALPSRPPPLPTPGIGLRRFTLDSPRLDSTRRHHGIVSARAAQYMYMPS